MKRCSRCKQWLDRSAFPPNGARRDGLQIKCRACQIEYAREHYEKNREYCLTKAKRSNDRRRAYGRMALVELKSLPCADCGATFAPWVTDFDHVRGVKRFNVSRTLGLKPEYMQVEAAKCDVVCSNCHRQRTQLRLTDAARMISERTIS